MAAYSEHHEVEFAMRQNSRIRLSLAAGVAAVAFIALPLGFDASTLSIDMTQAIAGNANGHDKDHGNGNAEGHDTIASNGNSHGSTASKLGALNAAHASETALMHANPNSRVGKIAAYKEAEIEAQALQAEAEALAEAAATADQAISDANQALTDAQQALADAQALNADAELANDVPQDQVDALSQAVADAETDLAAAEQAAEGADAAAAEAQAAADAAQDEADSALVNAANKDITDEEGNVLSDVRDTVNDLLGL